MRKAYPLAKFFVHLRRREGTHLSRWNLIHGSRFTAKLRLRAVNARFSDCVSVRWLRRSSTMPSLLFPRETVPALPHGMPLVQHVGTEWAGTISNTYPQSVDFQGQGSVGPDASNQVLSIGTTTITGSDDGDGQRGGSPDDFSPPSAKSKMAILASD